MMWTWSPPITVRMNPKPVGSQAPAKPQEQGVLTKAPDAEPSHLPKPEDVE